MNYSEWNVVSGEKPLFTHWLQLYAQILKTKLKSINIQHS